MQKKWLVVVNVLILIVVILAIAITVWNYSFEEAVVGPEECVEVNKVASFVYDSCYDAYTKNIFIEVVRGFDNYNLKGMKFSFFDFSDQSYDIVDVPMTNSTRAYKIPADKNPQNLDVSLDIVKDFSAPICEEPRKIFVKYCPKGLQQEGVDVSISPLPGVDSSDFITVEKSSAQDSDVLSLSLVDKERVWKSRCESNWKCGQWEQCSDGVQKRECVDSQDCFIPTAKPETARYCNGMCVENWECEWSKCSGGFTVPTCKDQHMCGTSYTIPQKLSCDIDGGCRPEIECGEWSECDVDYNFLDLVGGTISELGGTKSRVCEDKNGCMEPKFESKECSVNIDIYTRRFKKCGKEYVGIYNRLDNDLIARIDQGGRDNPYLNIHLDGEGDTLYCDYCFDGVRNGDEVGVDCGGSCQACEDKYVRTLYEKRTWWTRLKDWIKRMVT